jgi:hypothetical protein
MLVRQRLLTMVSEEVDRIFRPTLSILGRSASVRLVPAPFQQEVLKLVRGMGVPEVTSAQ